MKVLTANMCVAISGLLNSILPSLCILGGVLFGAVVVPPTFALIFYCSDTVETAIACCLAATPFFVLISFAVGCQGGRIVGAAYSLVTGKHDWKRERVVEFVDTFKEYDVVAIQELYTAWPFDMGMEDLLIKLATQAGFKYFARPAGRSLPSICMGTGLLIISKHKILRYETFTFRHQYFAEMFGCNRGAMYAQIESDGGSKVDFFTCHLTASMGEALLKGGPNFLIEAAERARTGQFIELRDYVNRIRFRSDKDKNWCVVAGDFNANVKHNPDGTVEEGRAMSTVRSAMVEGCGMTELGLVVSYGYIPPDKVLTNPAHEPDNQVTEDLIFVDNCEVVGFKNVPFLAKGKGGYTHLSDHLGLEVTLKESQVDTPDKRRI